MKQLKIYAITPNIFPVNNLDPNKVIQLYESGLHRGNSPFELYDRVLIASEAGTAYFNLSTGEKADNIEQAIHAYGEAVDIAKPEDMLELWAVTTRNLGYAYYSRKKGSMAQNIGTAISLYNQALPALERLGKDASWANTANDLGAAYLEKPDGNPAENITYAIASFKLALTIRRKKATPVDWAKTMNNLGNAYASFAMCLVDADERKKFKSESIAAYEQALTIRTKDSMREDWAQTTRNLANAKSIRC